MKKGMLLAVFVAGLLVLSSGPGFACNGGWGGGGWGGGGWGGGGWGGGMMSGCGSSGMMGGAGAVPAADGSVLVIDPGVYSGSWSTGSRPPELLNLLPDGTVRWGFPLAQGVSALLATNGDLVVVVVTNGGYSSWGGQQQAPPAGVIGIDLVTGGTRWQTPLNPGCVGFPAFSLDGNQIYLASGGACGGMMGGGHMGGGGQGTQQGGLVTLDRAGRILWTVPLGAQQGRGGRRAP